ncbi:PREDICTED: protein FAM92A1-like [Hipposideros armiger]|uniref:Protein FAM92A1-like n=1 Tax=Hipposideros armiger TaxID=186990 RepID=A0A8B7Q4W4_HIPAR|nr:PREDICTED: protein FAM92A1-like [Hipposideros armiger]
MKGPAEGTGVREVQIQEPRDSPRGRTRHSGGRTPAARPSGRPRRALAESRIGHGGARRVAVETAGGRGGAEGGLSRPSARPDVSEPCRWAGPGSPRCATQKMWRRSLENRDAQTRQLQDAVTNVEKHFGELCQIFAAYVRKTARVRDKADLLVNEINMYASTETPNLKQGLKNFADEFAKLQDYRQAEVWNEVRVSLDDLKATLTARNREAKQLTQLERTRQRNPSDRHVIAENELQRATLDATRTTRHLEETIDNFEKQKIKDIKVFRNSLYPPDYSSRLDIVRANSKSPLQRSLSTKCVSGTGQVS